MPTPIITKTIPAKDICCGNIIVYLDHLWQIIKIEHSIETPYICFQAERQSGHTQLDINNSEYFKKDLLQITKQPIDLITIIEEVFELETK